MPRGVDLKTNCELTCLADKVTGTRLLGTMIKRKDYAPKDRARFRNVRDVEAVYVL